MEVLSGDDHCWSLVSARTAGVNHCVWSNGTTQKKSINTHWNTFNHFLRWWDILYDHHYDIIYIYLLFLLLLLVSSADRRHSETHTVSRGWWQKERNFSAFKLTQYSTWTLLLTCFILLAFDCDCIEVEQTKSNKTEEGIVNDETFKHIKNYIDLIWWLCVLSCVSRCRFFLISSFFCLSFLPSTNRAGNKSRIIVSLIVWGHK